MSSEVNNRYHTDATSSNGIGFSVSAEMSRDRVYRSRLNGTAVTSDVVFSIEITSLPVGGMMMRIACGITILRIVLPQVRPRAVAASA